jgi:hypothetical protein
MAQLTSKDKLSALAFGCSMLVLLLLGARLFTSYDLGYHLAFGETFFDSGTIVDYTPFIYTLPALDTPAADRPEPGPGSWYDDEGRYRFPNANWLSQLFIYGAWSLGGAAGLNLLQILIVAGLFILLIAAMQRSRVPFFLITPSLLLIGLIISPRLNMRPELFGYLCLMAQYLLLARLAVRADKPMPPSWTWVAGMVLIQLLCINLHSYFLLGLAITGAVWTEYVLHALNKRLVGKDIPGFLAYRKVISRLSITLAGMMAVCFINPWGWRLVLQPFQTVLYMKKYGIGGPNAGINSHPWDNILELRGTISGNWPVRLSDYAVIIMLALVAMAVIFQLAAWLVKLQQSRSAQEGVASQQGTFHVRWAHLFMIAGMLAVGLQVRRNIGAAGLIVVPSALICITEGCRYFLQEKVQTAPRQLLAVVNAAVIVLVVVGGYQMVTGKLYEADNVSTRFGFGLSNTVLPVGAASWLNEHAPDARVWCDFQSSSTLRFFTRPHKEVPILTNTWAYPPQVMASNIFSLRAKVPFSLLADQYNIDAVLLRSDWSLPLHRQLGADPQWKMVHVEGVNVLYLRANAKYGALAARHEIKPGSFDPDAFVAQQVRKDPSFTRAILSVADTLEEAGEQDLAIDTVEAGLKYLPPDIKVWKNLLNLYNNREAQRRESGDKRCVDDLMRMKYVIERILELEPGNAEMRQQLTMINKISSLFTTQ